MLMSCTACRRVVELDPLTDDGPPHCEFCGPAGELYPLDAPELAANKRPLAAAAVR